MPALENNRIGLILVFALIFGLLFDYFFWGKILGFSFVVYIFLLLVSLFWLLYLYKIAFNKKVLWYFVPMLFFAGMVAVRDNQFLTFWNFALTFLLLLVLANHILGQSIKNNSLIDYIKIVVLLPLRFLEKSFAAIGQILKTNKASDNNRKTAQIIKGLLITVPILFLFLVLLSSADLVFQRFVSSLFDLRINFTRIFWILLITIFWFGFHVFLLENSRPEPNPAASGDAKQSFGKIETGILFGTLNLLFLIFVIIQFKYLFGGQQAVSQLGYTYSEYARKGFFELMAVAAFSFLLVFGVEKYIERKDQKHLPVFKFWSASAIMLVLVMMVSAFMRLKLYEDSYGFTLLRLISHSFIIWLAVAFLLLLYKIFTNARENVFIFRGFIATLIFFAALNFLNPDAWIAKRNINRFAASGKLDTAYLYSLSADAVPEISRLLHMDGLKNKNGKELPVFTKETLKLKKPESSVRWQSFHLSRYSAGRLIESRLK